MYGFCAFPFKVGKKWYYDPEHFPEKFITGIKKRRILWCFKFDDVDFKIFY